MQASFRDRLVAHANRLAADAALAAREDILDPAAAARHAEAKAWLSGHRLIVLYDHPDLARSLRSHLGLLRRLVLAENLVRVEVYREVVAALGAAPRPIPIAPLKGISLLGSVYAHDLGQRHMSDLDVLVPADRIHEAIGRLVRLGYEEPTLSRRARFISHHRHAQGPRALVELHTRLGTAFIPNSTWRDVAPLPALVHGVWGNRLSPVTELVHLLIHFYKHRPFVCLVWVDEILGLAARLPEDEQRHALPEIAARLGCRTPLAVTIDLLRRALGPGFLPHLRLEDLRASALRTRLHGAIFLDPPDPLRPMRRRSKLVEEVHAALLVDHFAEAPRDLFRKAVGHFVARFPTRIRSHPDE